MLYHSLTKSREQKLHEQKQIKATKEIAPNGFIYKLISMRRAEVWAGNGKKRLGTWIFANLRSRTEPVFYGRLLNSEPKELPTNLVVPRVNPKLKRLAKTA